MSDYIERMEKEAEELQQRINDLGAFQRTEVFYTLEEVAQWEMHDQLHAMQQYANTLNKRIARAKGWVKPSGPGHTCSCNQTKGNS